MRIPCIEAALRCGTPKHTVLTVLADKEEVGSQGNTGLASSFMRDFICDLAKQEGMEGYEVMRKSKCLSADVTAAFDPTYAQRI